MVDNPTQDQQGGKLVTSLGKDKLVLGRFDGVEGLGEMFEYRIEALSTDPDVDFDEVYGTNCSIHLETVDNVGRDFSGVLVETRRLGQRGNLYLYSLMLRPWLWLLSMTSNCRIFSNMTPKAIILQVFADHNFPDVLDRADGDYPTLEYTVQYRETDLNFVLRLMEQYGIYYYFQHEKGEGVGAPSKHTLVLANSAASHDATPGLKSVVYLPSAIDRRSDQQQLDAWELTDRIRSGSFVLNDYDYEKPVANLVVDSSQPRPHANGQMEIYDFPGDFKTEEQGKALAKVLLNVEKLKNNRYSATGSAPSLAPGYRISRTSADGAADYENQQEYLVVRCTHAYGSQSYESAPMSPPVYLGAYEFIAATKRFAMLAKTPCPTIYGSQSAKVIGKKDKDGKPANPGDEIDIDELGRVLVEFHWDRKKKPSRRIRVAQQWAGGNLRGFFFFPRIGDEVLVQYVDGDPDRPVIVGSVYNGSGGDYNQTPLPMPDNKNISGVRTDSTKGHGGYNALTFDDTAGAENLFARAQKDLNVKVLNNETRDVGANQQEVVHVNLTQNVGGAVNRDVGGNETVNVGSKGPGTYSLTASEKIVLTVGSSSITIDLTGIKLDAPMITLSAPIISASADAALSMTSAAMSLTANAAFSLTSPVNLITGSGNTTIAGGSLTLVAPTVALSLTGMTPAGIPII